MGRMRGPAFGTAGPRASRTADTGAVARSQWIPRSVIAFLAAALVARIAWELAGGEPLTAALWNPLEFTCEALVLYVVWDQRRRIRELKAEVRELRAARRQEP